MTRFALALAILVAAALAGPRGCLAAGPFVLLFSAMLCLLVLWRSLLSRPRRIAAFVLSAVAPLTAVPLACLWLWTEVLRALPEGPQRLGEATLITLALGPGFTGLTAAALWLWHRPRRAVSAARAARRV